MLIWKTQSLNPNIASVRYRCIFPSRFLQNRNFQYLIYGKTQSLPLTQEIEAVIFVKSFTNDDLQICRKAHRLGIPIILDLCDNIFIDDYGDGSKQDYVPSENFRKMAAFADAIVTTGLVLKKAIEENVKSNCSVWIIPDGCETLEDVEYALKVSAWQRWFILLKYRSRLLSLVILHDIAAFLKSFFNQSTKRLRRLIKLVKRDLKRIKSQIKRVLGFAKCLIFQSSNSSTNLLEEDSDLALDRPDLLKNLKSKLEQAGLDEDLLYEQKKIESNEANSLNTKQQQKIIKPLFGDASNDPVKTILWFGHHGSSYSQSGIANILEVASAIEAISHDIPVRLLVISNNYFKFLDLIAPLPFPTFYQEWHPIQIYQQVSDSDVVIIPNSKTPFSLSKSANRAVLALSLGVPVLATQIPSMDPFIDCVLFDDWENGLRQYLTQPELVANHVETAQSVIQTSYRGEAIAEQWVLLLNSIHKKSYVQSQHSI